MAEILLDSDVIIAWLRGRPPFAELVPELLSKANLLLWTPLSVAEIYAAVRRGEEGRIEHLFLILETVPLTAEIGKKAGNYLHAYSKSRGVDLGDALIAATAQVHGLRLWTLNKKHYPMKDLEFYGTR